MGGPPIRGEEPRAGLPDYPEGGRCRSDRRGTYVGGRRLRWCERRRHAHRLSGPWLSVWSLRALPSRRLPRLQLDDPQLSSLKSAARAAIVMPTVFAVADKVIQD